MLEVVMNKVDNAETRVAEFRLNRRTLLAVLAGACLADEPKPDFTLHIAPVELEIAPRRKIKTTGYNGGVPGPVMRMKEGVPVSIDVYNDQYP